MAAYLAWGLLPIYWKALARVSAMEILSHRIVWSLVFLVLSVTLSRDWRAVLRALRNPTARRYLSASGALLYFNWFIYIWSVNNGHILDSSLGYYITPLLNVLCGRLFFRDRLNRLQWGSIALAALGVAILLVGYGQIPWVALSLAGTFAGYGLLRKMAPVESTPGLLVETAILFPVALATLFWFHLRGTLAFGRDLPLQNLLLIGAGVVTSIPLQLFAFGARQISLVTLGFVQYFSPSVTFLLGTLVYGEPLSTTKSAAFCLIWTALGLYSLDGICRSRGISPT
jgi:chloramphenicol-sensitive protein RarD